MTPDQYNSDDLCSINCNRNSNNNNNSVVKIFVCIKENGKTRPRHRPNYKTTVTTETWSSLLHNDQVPAQKYQTIPQTWSNSDDDDARTTQNTEDRDNNDRWLDLVLKYKQVICGGHRDDVLLRVPGRV